MIYLLAKIILRPFYFLLEKILNLYFKVKSPTSIKIIFRQNCIYSKFELEGLKPFVIIERNAIQIYLNKLKIFLNKLPYLAPVSFVTIDEYNKIVNLTYQNEIVRKIKTLQKIVLLLNLGQKSRWHSLVKLSQELGIKNNTFSLEAIIEYFSKLGLQFFKEFNQVVQPITNYNEFYKYKIDIDQPACIFQNEGMWFWAIIAPGTSPKEELNEDLKQIRKKIVEAEYLIQKSELKTNEVVSPIVRLEYLNFTKETNKNFSNTPYCNRPFNQMSITCEGNISFCCWANKPEHFIGNILEKDFEKIWNSDLVNQVRQEILNGKMPKICSTADGCPYHHRDNNPCNKPVNTNINYIDIQLPNSHCNIGGLKPSEQNPACIMCERDEKGYRFQDDSKFDQVLEKISTMTPQLSQLHIQGVAEPFWKDAIFKVLDKINFDQYKDTIFLTTVTNGINFNQAKQKKFLERVGAFSISLSMDASTPETYKKIRRLNVFNEVLKNAKIFGRFRKLHGKNYFRLQNNINLLNIHEIKEMVQIAKDINVDAFEINPTGGHRQEITLNKSNAHLFKEAEIIAREEAKKLGVRLEILRPLDLDLNSD